MSANLTHDPLVQIFYGDSSWQADLSMSPGLGACLTLQVYVLSSAIEQHLSQWHIEHRKLHYENIHLEREEEDPGLSRDEG